MNLHDIDPQTVLTGLGLKLKFIAIDLAPNEQLESGMSVIDRDRNLVRIDKLYKDVDILAAVASLGPLPNSIVLIDMPKSLSLQGKWRQERMKMHALPAEAEPEMRYDARGKRLYNLLKTNGTLPLLYFNYWTRLNYRLLIPFRSRSPQGCRALQTAIEHQLGIKNLPQNLAGSSVLESMVGAYAAWSIWAGQNDVDYQLQEDDEGFPYVIPKAFAHKNLKSTKYRHYRRSGRFGRSYQGAGAAETTPE